MHQENTVFKIYFFRGKNARYPVLDYLHKLPKPEKAKALAYIQTLAEMGYRMRRPMADYLGDKTGLYELRPAPHRVIYYYFDREKIVLLHALRKKTDKLLPHDLDTATFNKEVSEIYGKHDMIDYEKELENDEAFK